MVAGVVGLLVRAHWEEQDHQRNAAYMAHRRRSLEIREAAARREKEES
jgi:hypothetical protein